MLDQELAIGEVAERSGLAVSAIRFYEDKGLIRATRTAGGQRRFRRDPVTYLHKLEDLATKLSLPP